MALLFVEYPIAAVTARNSSSGRLGSVRAQSLLVAVAGALAHRLYDSPDADR